ncbi:MAG: S49 family peptidase [Hyphomicrobiales bacterium]
MIITESGSLLSRLLPARFTRRGPLLPLVKLHGTIGVGSPLRPGLNLDMLNSSLERAFSYRNVPAVLLSINSPGGSAVQSALIHNRIRQLAQRKNVKVISFCEDVAASGGYWLATAGDEIYADHASIVGSIGVIYAGFGFVEALDRLGVERRVHTAGKSKMMLDPFQPQRDDDVARLKDMQADIHETFKTLVRTRRDGKLKVDDDELFSGAFWSGGQAREIGLVDGLGSLHDVVTEKFGAEAILKPVTKSAGWMRRLRMPPQVARPPSGHLAAGLADEVIETLEARALWQRFGL